VRQLREKVQQGTKRKQEACRRTTKTTQNLLQIRAVDVLHRKKKRLSVKKKTLTFLLPPQEGRPNQPIFKITQYPQKEREGVVFV